MNKDRIIKVIKIIIFIDVAISVMYFFIKGFPKTPMELFSKVGILILFSTIIFIIFDKFLWKLGFKDFTFGGIPVIEGIWKGEIINEQDGIRQKANIRIRQTYLNVFIEVDVDRGDSTTLIGDLVQVNNKWQLIWNWDAKYEGSEFYGTTIVDLRNDNNVMQGLYFTNSNFTGLGCTYGTFKAKKKP